MDELKNNQLPDNQPDAWLDSLRDFSSTTKPEAQDLTRLEEAFLSGIQRAKRQAQPKHTRARTWRWALAGALVVALLALGPWLLPHRSIPVAAGFAGMQGQVISAVDLMPVAGVEVRLEYKDSSGDQPVEFHEVELVDITDAGGFFDVPAQELAEPCKVAFSKGAEKLGEIQLKPEEYDFRGFQQFVVKDSGQAPCEEFEVFILPGGTEEVTPGLSLHLDDDANDPWQGKLVYNRRWPAAFNYGCVIDGIFSLEGPQVDGLELEVGLASAVLEHFNTTPQQVRLLVFNDAYLHTDPLQGFHRGWYEGSHPPEGFGLAPVALAYGGPDRLPTVRWHATPDTQYALSVPMRLTGELSFTYNYRDAADLDAHYLNLMLLNQNRPQLYTVRVFRDEFFTGDFVEQTLQPRRHQPFYEMTGTPRLPDAPKSGFEYFPGGRWRMELLDFTLSDRYIFEIDVNSALPPPGRFKLEMQPGSIGGASVVKVTGDLSRLVSPPAWDLDRDFVDDAYGPEAKIPAPYPGTYRFQVTLREKNGAVTVWQESIEVVDEKLPLFLPSNKNTTPVIDCSSEPPGDQQQLLVLSAGAVANPLPYGYSSSGGAGPAWLSDMPPEFTGVPLRKMRMVVYASPAGGDTGKIGFQPHLMVIPRAQTGPLVEGVESWKTPSGQYLEVTNTRLSHLAKYALRAASRGEDVRAMLTAGEFYEYHVLRLSDSLAYRFGWDTDDLPPADEIIETLQVFTDSSAFGRRFVTERNQRLEWEFDLYGRQLSAGDQFLLVIDLETEGLLLDGQWMVHTGVEQTGYVEFEAEGIEQPWRGYFDLSPLLTD